MLITSTFTSNKAGLPDGHAHAPLSKAGPSSSSSSLSTGVAHQSTSTATNILSTTVSHQAARIGNNGTATTNSHHQAPIASSRPSLSQAGTTALNVFLRSSRSICPLQIADIVGGTGTSTSFSDEQLPAVRKGKVKASQHQSIPCCFIDAYPFERCEIVATVVKKNVLYRQRRVPSNVGGGQLQQQGQEQVPLLPLAATAYDGVTSPVGALASEKGKGKEYIANDEEIFEDVNLIFYELDDDSGASITCVVHPSKVYAKELSEVRMAAQDAAAVAAARQRTSSASGSVSRSTRGTGHADLGTETSASENDEDGDEDGMATPKASRTNHRKAKGKERDKPKSNPRLWIYRYRSPPRPAPKTLPSSANQTPTFTVPIHTEGTIVRIIGKIFVNAARGNERQLEASSIEAIYEEARIEGKRKISARGNPYAEWHHARKCKKLRREVYADRLKVREMIGLERACAGSGGGVVETDSQVSLEQHMEDSTTPSFADTQDPSNATSCISSTSLLDASRLPFATRTGTDDGRQPHKARRAKLPSCSTLYKQKIPITREIFALYAHQFFRDVVRKKLRGGQPGNDGTGTQGDKDRTASVVLLEGKSRGSQTLEELVESGACVTMQEMQEDKNLKWLAEIYARNEAKRQMAETRPTPGGGGGGGAGGAVKDKSGTPLTVKKRFPHSVESSVILPTSSPVGRTRTTSAMSDTTNVTPKSTKIASTSPISTGAGGEAKIRPSASAVNKIRNDLFRSTILKLVKEGTLVIIPPEVFDSTPPSTARCTCGEKAQRHVESLPDVVTARGEPLRAVTLAKLLRQPCSCFSGFDGSDRGKSVKTAVQEERYALLTPAVLVPILERIVARLAAQKGTTTGVEMDLDLDRIWSAIRRYDDMWRHVSRGTVKEALEMV